MSDNNGLTEADRLILIIGGLIVAGFGWSRRDALWAWLVGRATDLDVLAPSAAIAIPGAGGAGLDAARLAIVLGFLTTAAAISWRLRTRRNPVVPKVPPPA